MLHQAQGSYVSNSFPAAKISQLWLTKLRPINKEPCLTTCSLYAQMGAPFSTSRKRNVATQHTPVTADGQMWAQEAKDA